ncbi:MAG: hypothetical protein H6Q14_106 [Bacteroidetes bacterium]|jgi:hypothetical protein|nr:hypothetical protein [Bacteroidota bacterium]
MFGFVKIKIGNRLNKLWYYFNAKPLDGKGVFCLLNECKVCLRIELFVKNVVSLCVSVFMFLMRLQIILITLYPIKNY